MSVQVVEKQAQFEPRPFKWSTAEYEEFIEQGRFQNRRVELIDGEILEMSPMMEPHARGVTFTAGFLAQIFPFPRFIIRQQMPFSVGEGYRPEPDLVILRAEDMTADRPPTEALLIVEVSDSTLRYDRNEKASLYARANIQEYWILNVIDRVLEVHRFPEPSPYAVFGALYSHKEIFRIGESVSPLAAPDSLVTISDLLS